MLKLFHIFLLFGVLLPCSGVPEQTLRENTAAWNLSCDLESPDDARNSYAVQPEQDRAVAEPEPESFLCAILPSGSGRVPPATECVSGFRESSAAPFFRLLSGNTGRAPPVI